MHELLTMHSPATPLTESRGCLHELPAKIIIKFILWYNSISILKYVAIYVLRTNIYARNMYVITMHNTAV